MTNQYIKDKLNTLPLEPGCYQMKDKDNNIIYVGKAKKLKNRVSSYFTGSHNFKTTKLVSQIADFDYIVTKTEKEALILEINLIKKYRPIFNIQFMDDSSYPYIQLETKPYPRLSVVRLNKKKKNGLIFGPYTDAGAAREIVTLLENMYPLRKCKNMPEKVCLYYHMNACLGPCEYKIDENKSAQIVDEVTRFLKGDTKDIIKLLKDKLNQAVEEEKYEQAGEYKKILDSINHISSKQDIQQNLHKEMDVFNYYVDHGYLSINVLFIRQGVLLDKTVSINPIYEQNINEEVESYIIQFYQQHQLPKEIIVNDQLDINMLNQLLDNKVYNPSKGIPYQLLKTSANNAAKQLETYLLLERKKNNNIQQALQQLSNIVGKNVSYFEIFDNSHIMGTNAVAACVVWDNGFKNSQYRKYKVSYGGDDLANMEEVFYRRYFRLLTQGDRLPDIVFVDGAENQMKAVLKIKNDLNLNTMICGLVKNDKHQTDDLILEDFSHAHIDKQTPLFFLLSQLQDEVHRVAITFHKQLRSKEQTKSILDEVSGIGPVRKKLLLKTFKSFKGIKEASIQQLSEVVGESTAINLYNTLHLQPDEQN